MSSTPDVFYILLLIFARVVAERWQGPAVSILRSLSAAEACAFLCAYWPLRDPIFSRVVCLFLIDFWKIFTQSLFTLDESLVRYMRCEISSPAKELHLEIEILENNTSSPPPSEDNTCS